MSVKPFTKVVDLYPGFKLEEECFSKAIIKDVDSKTSKRKLKSDLDEGPMTYPREKPGKQNAYEIFLEQVVDSKKGIFYPEKDENGNAKKDTGLTYYINAIYRLRRATGAEFLFTKGMAYAFTSLGNRVKHAITTPEIWTKTNFDYLTKWNDRTNQLEREFQGVSGNEDIYLMPFNKENLKQLYDRRQNDLISLAVKEEATKRVFEVKDVTGNITKSYELLRDRPFSYLFTAEYIPKEIKAELRQEAVAQGLIKGGAGDFNQPPSGATTPKNTYQ